MPIPRREPSALIWKCVSVVLGSLFLLFTARGAGECAVFLAQAQALSAVACASFYLISEEIPGSTPSRLFLLSLYTTCMLLVSGAPVLELGGVAPAYATLALGFGCLVFILRGSEPFFLLFAIYFVFAIPGYAIGYKVIDWHLGKLVRTPPPFSLEDVLPFLTPGGSAATAVLVVIGLFQTVLFAPSFTPQPSDFELLFETVGGKEGKARAARNTSQRRK